MVLGTIGWLQFVDSDKLVVVVELLYGREVSVLLLLDWQVRSGVFEAEFVGSLILEHTSEDT